MGNRQNHEGYNDPTSAAAIGNVEHMEMLERRSQAKEYLSRVRQAHDRIFEPGTSGPVCTEEELIRRLSVFLRSFKAVRMVIRQVRNPEYQVVLELRYLAHKSWEQIAGTMQWTPKKLHSVHRRALDACSHVMSEEAVLAGNPRKETEVGQFGEISQYDSFRV